MKINSYLNRTFSIIALAVSPLIHALEARDLDLDTFDFDQSAVFARIDNQNVFVNGVLDERTLGEFNTYLSANPDTNRIVIGTVPGSRDDDATREVLNAIIDRGLDTHLLNRADSGGVDLWLAGRIRTREPNSVLGVHSWGATYTPQELRQGLANGEIDQALFNRLINKPRNADGNIEAEATDFPVGHELHQEYIEVLERSGIRNAAEFYYFTINAAPAAGIHEVTSEELARFMLVRTRLFSHIPNSLMSEDIKQALSSIQAPGIGGVLANFYTTDEGQIREALQTISPAVSSTTKTLFNNIRDYQALMDSQLLSAGNLQQRISAENRGRFWVSTTEGRTRQDSENLGLGYKSDDSRTSFGYDYRLTESTMLGVLYGRSENKLDYHNDGGSNEINGDYVGVYGMSRFGQLFTEANLLYGKNDSEVKRTLPSEIRNQQATSDVDGKSLAASALVGYDFNFDQLTVSPVAGLSYSKVSLDGFREAGNSVLAVRVDDTDFDSLQSKVGVRLSYPLGTPWFSGTLNMKTYWLHELESTERNHNAQFLLGGNSFRVDGLEGDKNVYIGSLNYQVNYGERLTVSLGADYQQADEVKRSQYTAQVSYWF